MSHEDKLAQILADLNTELPDAPPPGGIYTPIVYVGNMIYVSGHGPNLPDGTQICGSRIEISLALPDRVAGDGGRSRIRREVHHYFDGAKR